MCSPEKSSTPNLNERCRGFRYVTVGKLIFAITFVWYGATRGEDESPADIPASSQPQIEKNEAGNNGGKRSADELRKSRASAEGLFTQWDQDRDGRLSEAEFSANLSEDQLQISKRDFELFDWNDDAALSLPEFLAIPSFVSVEERGPIPDPVVSLMNSRFDEIKKKWNDWKPNDTNTIPKGQFIRSGITQIVPGISFDDWTNWDSNNDDAVSLDECQHALEIAYGIRHPSGFLLRREQGLVLDWTLFLRLDTNNDQGIDSQEYVAFFGSASAEAAQSGKQEFSDADVNGDGKLAPAEYAALEGRWSDTVMNFLKFDTDLDGNLSLPEFSSGIVRGRKPLAKAVFSAFDSDNNEMLSLQEYRSNPFANELAKWDLRPKDSDNDGRISLNEFQLTEGFLASAFVSESFRRLDQNTDGFLDFDEYWFMVYRSKVPREVLHRFWDQDSDGQLTWDEVLAFNGRTENDFDIDYEVRLMRMEESFADADLDNNKQLSVDEFAADKGKSVVSPTTRSRKGRAPVDVTNDIGNWRMLLLVAFNLILLVGAAIYVLRKS